MFTDLEDHRASQGAVHATRSSLRLDLTTALNVRPSRQLHSAYAFKTTVICETDSCMQLQKAQHKRRVAMIGEYITKIIWNTFIDNSL